ncbi:MAG: hypothetical protein A3D24_00580 [Candidatus Blackburnbacteria bacterium RIFCSPHIGHO2_02_FULL_39_13]|uniref:DUF4134 domain-containing protein n=1 Tax=Candidatus Blackburnbacteria bacterium RIFCSPLOWO2_01_FULL_40_20 TaxID=1797519 RepID=A0A1G1VFT5_9BACT|nr:MAG: hypothetical protein UT38_C0003G0033 [Microgenomates group bacterium GW2011_GWA2_39_19]OGY07571.1 MAG: hypothetical protein A2694_04930 [Candidatus Blackburnbacteria bacterium RIFCSPHIGHO2_01_FULL_40_17]OGY08654.1 MAG: hypothetical protein A3D24_00580 [Candidatus Blackburnbacteria bacterium RIFCSPHIGHO2_02_FULL_39_13]OGY14288.1 MAG: hypothetical protein A3A77_02325 [Candidatus Blackburnbacteria bacterium RIFCSPLOWO2_01_FULL_40_20]OGY14613.1 MAG: hypothetical protein A3I52_00530 [Candida
MWFVVCFSIWKEVRELKKIITSTLAAGQALMLTASIAMAQGNIDLKPKGDFLELGNITVAGLISSGIKLALIIAAVVFFFMLVVGGIRWILSGGDKGKTEEARNQITAALVGLVIVFSAWAITQLIRALFGVDILNLNLTDLRAK